MKPAIRLFLPLFVALMCPARGALEYVVLDSSKPGPTLIVFAPGEGAGAAVLRQLQQHQTDYGRLVLARPAADAEHAVKPSGWESVPEFAALATRFSDSQVLVFREDDEAHSFDKRFHGDTVQGMGEASSAVLTALRALPSEVVGKDWQALPAAEQDRRIVVTTNARVDMTGGLRPAAREREFRTAAATLLRQLKMTEQGAEKAPLFSAARPGVIRVAVYDGRGALNGIGRGPAWLRSRLARDAGMQVELLGATEIIEGALDHADVFVLGGGSATPQSEGLGKEGRAAIVRFVHGGGGFVGICAGACMGSNGSGKWNHLELLPVEIGATYLECETPLVWANGPLGSARVEDADLHGGPSFKVMETAADKVTVWATFQRNETSKEKGEYSLEGTPAVVSGVHGEGRVVLTSTHCERPPSPSNIFPDMVRWSARSASPSAE